MDLKKFWATRIASIVLTLAGCFGLQMVAGGLNDFYQRLIALAGLYVTLSVSLNLINGITGQFSVGHAAFYQVGAYLSGYVGKVAYHNQMPLPLWVLLMTLAGAAFAGIAGLVVGLPSLRLKGDYLAIVTLGFGEIIRILVQNTEALGGAYGLNVSPQFKSIAYVWILAILCIAVCRNLLKTAHGLPFLAVREDEIASLAMGVNVTATKVVAFVVGAMFAGAAGTLLAYHENFLTPQTFGMDVSFIILTMVVLGGTGSITGSAITAVFLSALPELLRSFKDGNGNEITLAVYTILASLCAFAGLVAVTKAVTDGRIHETKKKWIVLIGGFTGSILLGIVLNQVFQHIPAIAAIKTVTAAQLRMVIFAVSLIVVMLLRPQGIFAHHEFSWNWLMSKFGKKAQTGMGVAS